MLPSREKFVEWVEDYKSTYEDIDSNDNIHEYVEGLVPHSYHEISKQFDDMSLEIVAHHVGMPIWKVMWSNLYEHYYCRFCEVYEEEREEFQ
tara:strand:+ start:1695 stop:1970 length:276 start_codon:yes stop_codon:yes gene_type:complete